LKNGICGTPFALQTYYSSFFPLAEERIYTVNAKEAKKGTFSDVLGVSMLASIGQGRLSHEVDEINFRSFFKKLRWIPAQLSEVPHSGIPWRNL